MNKSVSERNFSTLFNFFLSLEHHKKWINEFNHRFSLFVINVSFSQFLEHKEQKNGKSCSITLILIFTNTRPLNEKVFNVSYAEVKHRFLCYWSIRRNWENFKTPKKLLVFITIFFFSSPFFVLVNLFKIHFHSL